MRLRIPDLSGYREKLKRGGALKSGKGFTPLSLRRLPLLLKPAWLVAAVVGVLSSFLTCVAAEGFLVDSLSQTQRDLAKIVSTRPASILIAQSQRKENREVAFTPFNVAEKASAATDTSEVVEEEKAAESFTLVGTLPNVGAWLSAEGGGTVLVLRGQEYSGYRLKAVARGEALLTKGAESFPLYLNLGALPKPKESADSASKTATPAAARDESAGVVKASEGSPGSIKREIIDKLLMNPYDEIAKMRLRPKGNGMELIRAANDSFFTQLGLQQRDTIVSINGESLQNMANVNNAIASLLNNNQFSVGIVRDSKPMQLEYAIK